jgi:hypothetical protein
VSNRDRLAITLSSSVEVVAAQLRGLRGQFLLTCDQLGVFDALAWDEIDLAGENALRVTGFH